MIIEEKALNLFYEIEVNANLLSIHNYAGNCSNLFEQMLRFM